MKALTTGICFALITTGLFVPAARASACGGDGDGSSTYTCESANHDVSIDGLNNLDGSNTATLIVKSRKSGVYQGSEILNLAVKTAPVFDFSKSSFLLMAEAESYQRVKLTAAPASAKVTCPADSVNFNGVMQFRLIGEQEMGVSVRCHFGYNH